MENKTTSSSTDLASHETEIVDWIIPKSASEERKEIAKLFENFLVGKMQSGVIDVDPAKQIAELFVKIFQDATSDERLETALDTLDKQQDQLLKSFYLRVSEMRLKPVTEKLYQFMIELVHMNKIKEARHIYASFAAGHIKNSHDLLDVEKEMVSAKEISTAATKIVNFLKEQNKSPEAQELQQKIDSGMIKTLEDLAPWETMIITTPGGSDVLKPASTTHQRPIIEMSFGKRVWEGIHVLDQQLRNMLGMK